MLFRIYVVIAFSILPRIAYAQSLPAGSWHPSTQTARIPPGGIYYGPNDVVPPNFGFNPPAEDLGLDAPTDWPFCADQSASNFCSAHEMFLDNVQVTVKKFSSDFSNDPNFDGWIVETSEMANPYSCGLIYREDSILCGGPGPWGTNNMIYVKPVSYYDELAPVPVQIHEVIKFGSGGSYTLPAVTVFKANADDKLFVKPISLQTDDDTYEVRVAVKTHDLAIYKTRNSSTYDVEIDATAPFECYSKGPLNMCP